jgi:hypothetical protein
MYRRLASLSQRDEAFWVGMALLVIGSFTPESLHVGTIGVSEALLISGTSILVIRILVGVFRILQIALKSYKNGYKDGQRANED